MVTEFAMVYRLLTYDKGLRIISNSRLISSGRTASVALPYFEKVVRFFQRIMTSLRLQRDIGASRLIWLWSILEDYVVAEYCQLWIESLKRAISKLLRAELIWQCSKYKWYRFAVLHLWADIDFSISKSDSFPFSTISKYNLSTFTNC